METPRERYAYKNDPTYQKAQNILGAHAAKDTLSKQAEGQYPHNDMTEEQKAKIARGRRDAKAAIGKTGAGVNDEG